MPHNGCEVSTLGQHLPRPQHAPDATRQRNAYPKGSEPGVKWADDGTATVTLPWSDQMLTNEGEFENAVRGFRAELLQPGYRLRLVEARHNEAAWHRDAPGEDAVTRPMWLYRFLVEPIPVTAGTHDFAATVRTYRKNRKAVTPAYDGDATLCVSWNDWQIGKDENGGTDGTEARFFWCIDQIRERAKELKRINRTLGKLVVIGGGDMVEGCDIFPNQSYSLDRDMRAQTNVATDMILWGLDNLAPMFSKVVVLAVGGNHGQNRRGGNKINRTDNTDLLVFENAARTAERDARLQHVDFVIAQSEPIKAIDVNGHILATTHGDVYGKGTGGSIDQKFWNWFRSRAAGRLPGGDADVVIGHHFHHDASKDFGSVFWKQTNPLDGASMHFTDYSGQYSRPGMNTFVMTPTYRYTDEQVMRPPFKNQELGLNYA